MTAAREAYVMVVDDDPAVLNLVVTRLEMVGDKGVAEIIDFGIFNTRDADVAFDSGSDVADQEWFAGFGDKDVVVLYFGPYLQISH